MPTRYLPASFPLVRRQEASAGLILRSSLLRRMAQSQHWLWANLRRIYAFHGYEGFGPFMQNIPTTNGGPETMNTEVLPDNSTARPVTSFFVPRNWCGGTRVKINVRTTLTRTTADTTCKVIAQLLTLDDKPTGIWTTVSPGVGAVDNVLRLRVPQNDEYQIRVYLQLTNGDQTLDTLYANSVYVSNVSARYDLPDEQDLGGQAYDNQRYQKHYDIPTTLSVPVASALLKRIIDNTLNLYYSRGPELCQSSLLQPWNNTTSFVEVGRYVVQHVHGVDEWDGRMLVYVTGVGGAGCEVRLLVDGAVQQTWTALAAGNNVLTITAFNPGTPSGVGQERTITVEAKHAASTDWGTMVWGVYLWESSADDGSMGTIPTEYEPVDEAGLEGDDSVEADDNVYTERCGFIAFQRADRWLYKNRLRTLIADYRHFVYKRLATFASYSTIYDPRVDWTRGDATTRQLVAFKNITVNGTSSSENDVDGFGDYQYGAGSSVGYSETPFTYPTSMTHARHGRRLGFYYWGHVNKPLASEDYASWVLRIRGKRARPATMSTDQNGFGPIPEEPSYENRGYFEPVHNGSIPTNAGGHNRVNCIGTQDWPDWKARWLTAFRSTHAVATGVVSNTIRGRLPPINSGNPPATRPEGMLFEMEMNSIYWADEPLTQEALDALA